MDDLVADEAKIYAMCVDSTMESLDHINYESWRTWRFEIQLILNSLGLGFALKEEKPAEPTESSSAEEKAKYENWERSNYLALWLMKYKMADHIYSYLSYTTKSDNAKQMFDALKGMIMNDERIHAPSLLQKLVTMRYDGQGNVYQHLTKMGILVTRLRDVDVVLPEYLINQLALDSLPSQFDPVRLAYIVENEKWEWNGLIRRCTNIEILRRTNENGNESCHGKYGNDQQGNGAKKGRNIKCFSCGKEGHLAKNCRQA